jgi:hypothetical protein
MGAGQLQFENKLERQVHRWQGGIDGSRSAGEVHFKLRLPLQSQIQSVAVNGQPATLAGIHKDTVIIATRNEKKFVVVGRLN